MKSNTTVIIRIVEVTGWLLMRLLHLIFVSWWKKKCPKTYKREDSIKEKPK